VDYLNSVLGGWGKKRTTTEEEEKRRVSITTPQKSKGAAFSSLIMEGKRGSGLFSFKTIVKGKRKAD